MHSVRLGEFISANIEAILDDWETFARNLLGGAKMERLALRNCAESILFATASDMGSAQSLAQQASKSKGHGGAGGAESFRLDAASLEHSTGRVGAGFGLMQVISEYRALRASILRLWRESNPTPDMLDLDDITRFNESIDQSLAQAVAGYTDRADFLHRKMERDVREGEARFRMVADNMSQLAWTCDVLGNVTWYNQRWLDYTGLSFEDMKGWSWSKVQHPDYLERVVVRVKRSSETGEPWEDIFPLRGRDGSYRWFLSRAVPVRDEQGSIRIWFGTNTDVTEQIAMEENLRRAKEAAEVANIAKDNFLATLSHELRTPLTPVLATLASWENDRASFPSELGDDLSMIRRNVELEARLIDDLLDLTRIAKGKVALNFEVLDVQRLLEQVVAMYKSEIDVKGLELIVRKEAQSCNVRADAGRLQQAFWNVIRNAVKFTPTGGRIEIITANDAQGNIQVIITDTGIGIGPKMLQNLFNPFEQEHGENLKQYGGLGLGLAITRTLLEAQHAQIEAHSEGPGRGAMFTITMPCTDLPIEAHVEQPKTAIDKLGEEKCRRVLLVEDHEDTAWVLARLLRGRGHEVETAHSVAEALETIHAKPFDVLVSDIGLPDGTGIDLLRRLREQEGLKIPAVALTGFGMENDIARCTQAGFIEHLTKPVNFARLEESIQRACGAGDAL